MDFLYNNNAKNEHLENIDKTESVPVENTQHHVAQSQVAYAQNEASSADEQVVVIDESLRNEYFANIGRTEGGPVAKNYVQQPRSQELLDAINTRINRARGHIDGAMTVMARDGFCSEILMQLSACRTYIRQVERLLVCDHVKTNMQARLAEGDKNILEEFDIILKTLNR